MQMSNKEDRLKCNYLKSHLKKLGKRIIKPKVGRKWQIRELKLVK